MNTRKKIIISICSLCFIAIAAVVTVVSVLAAAKHTINSEIDVKFTAVDIAGTVEAKYQLATDTEVYMTTDGQTVSDTNKTITFTGDTDEQTYTLKPQTTPIEFAKEKRDLTFTYTFTNDGDSEYTATVTLPSGAENVINVSVQVKTGDSDFTDVGENLTVTVPARTGETAGKETFAIKLHLDDTAKDGKYNGTFAWVLEKPTTPTTPTT